jgi:hypothetical protein
VTDERTSASPQAPAVWILCAIAVVGCIGISVAAVAMLATGDFDPFTRAGMALFLTSAIVFGGVIATAFLARALATRSPESFAGGMFGLGFAIAGAAMLATTSTRRMPPGAPEPRSPAYRPV